MMDIINATFAKATGVNQPGLVPLFHLPTQDGGFGVIPMDQCHSARYHGLVREVNPKGFPLPGKAKGGMDALIFAGPTTWAIDVSVAKDGAPNTTETTTARYASKVKQYEAQSRITGFKTAPIIYSAYGFIHHRSVETLELIFKSTPLPKPGLRTAQLCSQAELLRGTHQAILALHARNHFATTEENGEEEVSVSNSNSGTGSGPAQWDSV